MTSNTQNDSETGDDYPLVEASDGRFFCEKCGRRYAEGAVECPQCEDEPLLDLHDPEVARMLTSFDDRDRTRRQARFTLVSIIVSLPLLGLVYFDFRAGCGGFLFGVLGLSALLMKMFPPKRRLLE